MIIALIITILLGSLILIGFGIALIYTAFKHKTEDIIDEVMLGILPCFAGIVGVLGVLGCLAYLCSW